MFCKFQGPRPISDQVQKLQSPWTPSWHMESIPHRLFHRLTPPASAWAPASLYLPFSIFPSYKSLPHAKVLNLFSLFKVCLWPDLCRLPDIHFCGW